MMINACMVREKFVNLTTSRSRINPIKYPNEVLLKTEDLSKVFLSYPEELTFAAKLSLHRSASVFNHKFSVSENHLFVFFEGQLTCLSTLIPLFEERNHRIFHKKTGQEYHYTYDKGLCLMTESQDPINWRDQIPLFKRKLRKTLRYKLHLMTVPGHAWIRLKDSEGNVFSVGVFRHPNEKLNYFKPYNSHLGYIRGGDLHEFLGQEAKWKKVSINITERQFTHLTRKIVNDQKNGVAYNTINSNCATYVQNWLKEIGINYSAEMSACVLILPKFIKKILIRRSEICTIVEAVFYPLRLLQNIVFSSLGIWTRKNILNDCPSGFIRFSDFFTKGQIHHPCQWRLVQEMIDECQGKILSKPKLANTYSVLNLISLVYLNARSLKLTQDAKVYKRAICVIFLCVFAAFAFIFLEKKRQLRRRIHK